MSAPIRMLKSYLEGTYHASKCARAPRHRVRRLWREARPVIPIAKPKFVNRTASPPTPPVSNPNPALRAPFSHCACSAAWNLVPKPPLVPLPSTRARAALNPPIADLVAWAFHAEIVPPTIRNLLEGHEKEKCLPHWAERAGVASAGAVLKREKYTASASWFLLNASGNQPPKIGSLTLQQAGRVCGMDTQRTRVSGYCREGAKAQSAVCSVREALYIPRGGGTVDAGDLKSSGATRAGSNPALGT